MPESGRRWPCSARNQDPFLVDYWIVKLALTDTDGVMEMQKSLRMVVGIALVLALAISAVAQETQATTDAGSPKLTIDSVVHDFGTVVSGTPLTFTFKVKNEGTADLLIKNVAPS